MPAPSNAICTCTYRCSSILLSKFWKEKWALFKLIFQLHTVAWDMYCICIAASLTAMTPDDATLSQSAENTRTTPSLHHWTQDMSPIHSIGTQCNVPWPHHYILVAQAAHWPHRCGRYTYHLSACCTCMRTRHSSSGWYGTWETMSVTLKLVLPNGPPCIIAAFLSANEDSPSL